MSTDLIYRLVTRIEALERAASRTQMYLNNLMREGRVLDVDLKKGLAKVDAQGLEVTAPWLQHAGEVSDWTPLSSDQRVILLSPGGDPGRGFVLPAGFTEKFGQKYSEGAMFARTIGASKMVGTTSGFSFESGEFKIKGNLIIDGDIVSNGSVTNKGKDIGSTHTNGGAPVD